MSRYVEIDAPPGVGLRPVRALDRSFLKELYASTREEELRPVPWSAEQKTAFLASQFELQHRYYQDHYDGARFDIIELESTSVGRLYLSREQDQDLRIVDIALMPARRGQGWGTALLQSVFAAARAQDLSVSIHVERTNPALQLYRRLGFELCEDKGVYLFLVRPARTEVLQ